MQEGRTFCVKYSPGWFGVSHKSFFFHPPFGDSAGERHCQSKPPLTGLCCQRPLVGEWPRPMLFLRDFGNSILTGRGFLPICCIDLTGRPTLFKQEQMVCVVARMRHNTHHLLLFCSVACGDRGKRGQKPLLVRGPFAHESHSATKAYKNPLPRGRRAGQREKTTFENARFYPMPRASRKR